MSFTKLKLFMHSLMHFHASSYRQETGFNLMKTGIIFITVAKVRFASKGNWFLSLEIRYLKKRVWVFQNWFIKPVLPKTKPISIWPLENVLKNVLRNSNQNRYRFTGNRYHMTVGDFPETKKRDFWKLKPNYYAMSDPKRYNFRS